MKASEYFQNLEEAQAAMGSTVFMGDDTICNDDVTAIYDGQWVRVPRGLRLVPDSVYRRPNRRPNLAVPPFFDFDITFNDLPNITICGGITVCTHGKMMVVDGRRYLLSSYVYPNGRELIVPVTKGHRARKARFYLEKP